MIFHCWLHGGMVQVMCSWWKTLSLNASKPEWICHTDSHNSQSFPYIWTVFKHAFDVTKQLHYNHTAGFACPIVCVWLCNIHLFSQAGAYFSSAEGWLVAINANAIKEGEWNLMPIYETQLMNEYFAGVSNTLFMLLWWLHTCFMARILLQTMLQLLICKLVYKWL